MSLFRTLALVVAAPSFVLAQDAVYEYRVGVEAVNAFSGNHTYHTWLVFDSNAEAEDARAFAEFLFKKDYNKFEDEVLDELAVPLNAYQIPYRVYKARVRVVKIIPTGRLDF